MTGRGLRRYLDDLLRGLRPRPFRATTDEAEQLRIAIELYAPPPAAERPRPEFVDELHRRLAAELAAPGPDVPERGRGGPVPAEPVLRPRSVDRRRLLVRGAGLAAASAAVGAAATYALTDEEPASTDSGTVTPTAGTWQPIALGVELPEGAVRAFDLGAVAGFLHRVDGVPQAVSSTCTHQGCRLHLDAARRNLDCPCHTTVFALSGELVAHQLPRAPAPLPHFATREVDGVIQVYAPPSA